MGYRKRSQRYVTDRLVDDTGSIDLPGKEPIEVINVGDGGELFEDMAQLAIGLQAYLRHVFTELPKATRVEDIERLLPTQIDPSRLQPDAG